MKNSNLLNRLLSYSHEKQSPQRFGRYAVMLIMLLTLGVGQMWATDLYVRGYNGTWDANSTTKMSGTSSPWTFTAKYWSNASGFKIADNSWGSINCGSATISNFGTKYNMTNSGSSSNMSFSLPTGGGIYTITVTLESGTYKIKVDKVVEEGNSWVDITDPTVYFDNSAAAYSNVSIVMGRVWEYGSNGVGYLAKTLSSISNTSLYYTQSIDNASGDASKYTTMLFANASMSGWTNNTKATEGVVGKTSYTGTSNNTLNSGTFLFKAANGNKGAALTKTDLTSYTDLNKTQTIQVRISEDNGSSYSNAANFAAWPGTINVTRTYLSSATASSSPAATAMTATTTSGALTSSITFTGASTTEYTFAGWSDSNSSPDGNTSKTYTVTATATKYAFYKRKQYTVSYGVNSSTRWGSITLNSGSAVTTTSSSTLNHGTAIAFTASPNSGYQVEGWYSDAACSVGNRLQSGGTSYDAGTLTAAKTVYVKFEEKTGGVITLNAGTGGQVSKDNSNWGSSATITGITSATTKNIYARANTGYTFNTWTKDSGSGSVTTNAASGVFTPVAYEDATVTASFNETMSTLTTANSYDGANPSWSAPTKSVSSIGISTTATVTAHANDLGYTLTSWTITGGVRTDGGATNANPITVRSNGDGAAVSVTANYVGSNRSVNIYLPNTGNSWSTSDNNWRFYKLPGESGETVTLAVDIDKYDYSSSSYKLGFNVYHEGWSDEWWKNKSDGDSNMDAHNCTNWGFNTKDGDHRTYLDLNVSGTYTFTLTNSENSASQALSVTYPDKSFIEGNFPTAWSEDAYTMTDNGTTETVTINITSTGDKEFRLVSHGKLFGTSTKITHATNSQTLSAKNMSDAGAVMTLAAYVTGNYTFSYNKSTKVLTVTWPVYNQVRISAASPSDATNVGNFDLSAPASNVRTVTRSLNANTTYTFKIVYDSEWYGYNSGTFTRNNSTSSNSRTLSADGGNMTLTTDYAGSYTFRFNESTKALSVDFPTAYKITFGKGSVDGTTGSFSAVDLDNGNSAVTSNSTWVKSGDDVKITAPDAKSGYRFLGWYDNNSATGDAITTNANCTISVTSAITVYACYAENLTAITITTDGHGTITAPSPNSSPYNLGVTTTQAINASANTGYSWSTWTTSGNAALGTTATTASNTAKGNGTNGGTGTITATFTPNNYDVVLDVNGATTGSDQTVTATFDAAMPTVQKGGSTPISAPSKTGYNFDGYTENNDGTGTKYYTSALANNHVWDIATNNTHIYAKWNAKQSTLSFDYQTSATGYGTSGAVSAGSKATYDAEMPTLSGTLPTAANGYAFMGFYSATGGGGTKYYNADGTSANNWAEDTESGTTLYAYYKKAEITALTLDAAIVETNGTVGVTPTVSPTPTGDTKLCFYVFHSNDNPLDPQPDITWNGTKATFSAGETSGTYKIGVSLRTGTACGGGTLLDSTTIEYQVAGSHTVTVNYKCGDDVIKAATSETATPLDWSGDITAPDIFGYTFARWDAADGVTIKNGDSDPVTTTTNATIQIKATYNGKLTAVYTQKSMIFFKNTLGWSDVYVNFYTGSYWNNPKGSGNQGVTNRNKHMTQLDDTDIWYYDYGAASITPSLYVSFTSASQDGSEFFWKSGGVNVVYPANYPDAINTDKSSETGFKAATPMFVPLATQDKVTLNQSSGGKADYYNAGYWTMYTPGTGYILEIYNSAGDSKLKSIDFESADDLMPMKAVVDLEGGTTYKFQLKRSGDIYYGNSGTMTYANHGSPTPWDMTNGSFSMCGITTNAAGDYTFNLSYSGNSSTPPHYRLRMAVDYPVADGDYRLIYKDAVHTNWHPSAIVSKGNDRKDTVSFFVRPGSSPVMKIQTATVDGETGEVSWGSDVAIPTATLTGLTSTDVYNFNLSMDGSGNISLESVDTYTGNFYIRTDAANSKWDNYRSDPDHLMVYSEYSIEHGGYTHYHAHWVNKDEAGRKNVKFTIANDYSPCISDTLTRETASGTWANIASFITEGGDLLRSANVRFMWDKRDNSISRAYVDGAQGDYSTNFLYMLNVEDGDDKIREENEDPLTSHKVTFKDNGNWMYEADIQAQPTAQIKLLSNWGTSNTITQYFRGASDATETLIGGSGSNWYDIRLIYDFKTNRLIAGLIPSGTIDEQMAIHADVMFIREHQGDIAQLTFAEKDSKMGAITDIETAYGVLRFNKWTLNNKSKADGHSPLSPLLSAYERDLFYVSFPFQVAMEDVFGFGTYGQHWIIEYYDGASRAANGYWQESGPNWKFVTNRKGKFFEPGQGYIIALDLDELGESSSVWANTDQVELYFPSYGTMDNITSSTATYEIPSHLCTINRTVDASGNPTGLPADYDRRVKDSHWNVLGVPTYVNPLAPNYANTDWITEATETSIGPNFLYEWNMDDNSVSAVSASGYTYHAMHAYLVQYCGDVTWTSSVSVPAEVAPRRNPAYRGNQEFRLEIQQNDKAVDQTYIKLSDDERVTTGFEFNYDLSKEFNKNKANIYTLIGAEKAAGNVLPLSNQTTVVPVGVQIKTNGDYTFSMPEGTDGIGVTLIDNETGIRTSLSALDYTINLSAGTYDNRFMLEISPIQQVTTEIEAINDEGLEMRGARKIMIDGLLYIVKDGKMFDARGARIE